jgi:hypothetical protein
MMKVKDVLIHIVGETSAAQKAAWRRLKRDDILKLLNLIYLSECLQRSMVLRASPFPVFNMVYV